MLPQCDAQGDKVVDRTKVGQDAIQQEKQLSDQGKTPFPIAYNPINPTISVEGKIRLSNETAIADLKLVDPGTGKVTKHVVIRGDAADFNSDLSSFLNFVGKSVAKFDCSKPKPKPEPKANGPLRFSIEYAGSYIDEAADPGNFHVFRSQHEVGRGAVGHRHAWREGGGQADEAHAERDRDDREQRQRLERYGHLLPQARDRSHHGRAATSTSFRVPASGRRLASQGFPHLPGVGEHSADAGER